MSLSDVALLLVGLASIVMSVVMLLEMRSSSAEPNDRGDK